MASGWFPYAIVAAILYGLHQIFTKMAADRISDGLGALVVEASAVATIALYLAALYLSHRWTQTGSLFGVVYSVVTGICVGAGTVAFFVLFQRGGPSVRSAGYSGRRRSHHGCRGNRSLSRTNSAIAAGRNRAVARRIVLRALISWLRHVVIAGAQIAAAVGFTNQRPLERPCEPCASRCRAHHHRAVDRPRKRSAAPLVAAPTRRSDKWPDHRERLARVKAAQCRAMRGQP